MPELRLDKFMAQRGIASRKELRELIRSGRVRVDGQVVRTPEFKLSPEQASVTLDGSPVCTERFHTYMMDKPPEVLTATEDGQQKTVLDLLPAQLRRMGLFPVGRLDKDTTGLLLLTNNGEFAHRVISPKSAVEKRYYARVDGEVDAEDVEAFRNGVLLRDGTKCLPALLEPADKGGCYVTLTEGKYHQVKRMLASRGKPVLSLRRLSIGQLSLDDSLGSGGWKELTDEDLCRVFSTSHMENLSKNPFKFGHF